MAGGDFVPLPCVDNLGVCPASIHRPSVPSATFTAIAAGLRPDQSLDPGLSQELCNLIAQTISQGIDTALQQRGLTAPLPLRSSHLTTPHPQLQSEGDFSQESPSPLPSLHSEISLGGEDEVADYELSEGATQNQLAYSGLFRPNFLLRATHSCLSRPTELKKLRLGWQEEAWSKIFQLSLWPIR